MRKLSSLKYPLRAVPALLRRRSRRGGQHPRRRLGYELIVETVKQQFKLSQSDPLPVRRATMDRFGIGPERRRKRARFEDITAASVPCEWVNPAAGRSSDAVVLYLHGGGYLLGSPRSHRPLTAGLAVTLGCRVLSVDYRLAPEHPCPAGIEDAVAAYRWLLDQGHSPGQIVMAGDSAGGGLTIATLVALREQGHPLPACAVPLSPWVDLRTGAESRHQNTGADYLFPANLHDYTTSYAGGLSLHDPRVSPVLADLSGLPPLFILAGGAELLLADSEDLARKAASDGVEVVLHTEPGEVHVYPIFHDMNPRGAVALGRIAGFVHAHLETRRVGAANGRQ